MTGLAAGASRMGASSAAGTAATAHDQAGSDFLFEFFELELHYFVFILLCHFISFLASSIIT